MVNIAAGPTTLQQSEGPKGSRYDVAPSIGSASEAGDFPGGASAASEGTSEAGHASRPPILGKLSLEDASSADTAISSVATFNPSSTPGDFSQAGDSEQTDSLDDMAKHHTYSVPEEMPGDVLDDEETEMAEGTEPPGVSRADQDDHNMSSELIAQSKAVQQMHGHHGAGHPSSNGDISSPDAEYRPPLPSQKSTSSHDAGAGLGADLFAGLSLG